MDKLTILKWLKENNPARLESLYHKADKTRQENVGDAIHLRGLIEISNFCRRSCGYCGISRHNKKLKRYRMTKTEILECAKKAKALKYGTVVLQAGEDIGLKAEWVADIIRAIKIETGLAVTLSLGERSTSDLKLWRQAGADRYLLRFETSDKKLYRRIHPPIPGKPEMDRLKMLKMLQKIGFEAGSGVMIGIPGQSYESLAKDIMLFENMDLDMIGVGPYIPHPATPLGKDKKAKPLIKDQVPNTEEMVYKVIALTRLLRPDANIPSTTALATINRQSGREKGLTRGANIVMPNLTPPVYRMLYELYPNKACINETADECSNCLTRRIESIGRYIGIGQGGRRR